MTGAQGLCGRACSSGCRPGFAAGGMDVVFVQERQGEGTDDADVLAEAFRDGRIALTCDIDFLVLASQLTKRGEAFAPICFWPQKRRGVGEIVRRIIRAAASSTYEAACSRVHFL